MRRPQIVKQIASVLQELAPDSKRILYGSEARGDAHADSDIDVLVILPDDSRLGSYARRKLDIIGRLFDVELDTGVRISPLVVLKSKWEQLKTPFTVNVANEGITL